MVVLQTAFEKVQVIVVWSWSSSIAALCCAAHFRALEKGGFRGQCSSASVDTHSNVDREQV